MRQRLNEAFKISDTAEWESWVHNEVLQGGSSSSEAFGLQGPLRMVRVNKAKEGDELKPKSRLVVPGHLDPELGGYRSDGPTTSPIAVRLLKTLIVSKQWEAWVFDVSSAFLSGKQTERAVYVKAPPDGLPPIGRK